MEHIIGVSRNSSMRKKPQTPVTLSGKSCLGTELTPSAFTLDIKNTHLTLQSENVAYEIQPALSTEPMPCSQRAAMCEIKGELETQ